MVPVVGARRSVTTAWRALALATLICCAARAGQATVAHAATVRAKGTYRAYNSWDDWKWWQADKCTQKQPIYFSEPSDAGRYPVVVYLHSMLADWLQNAEGRRFADAAAEQGFVAAAVTYDSWLASSASVVDGAAKCVFDPGSRGNALAKICARPKADCSKGVVVTGFSAGGAVAARARNNSADVRAVWLMGVTGPLVPEAIAAPAGTRALPDDRLRITVGRSDVEVHSPTTGQVTGIDLTGLNGLTGQSCSASPTTATGSTSRAPRRPTRARRSRRPSIPASARRVRRRGR
jgi:hypothetical protein